MDRRSGRFLITHRIEVQHVDIAFLTGLPFQWPDCRIIPNQKNQKKPGYAVEMEVFISLLENWFLLVFTGLPYIIPNQNYQEKPGYAVMIVVVNYLR